MPKGMSVYWQRFKSEEERFLEKVEKTETCWNWVAYRQPKGYGIFRHAGGELAHRFSYELYVGEIPEGMLIDHTCMNKSCVNPGHLRIVDNLTNIHENSRHYATRTHCKNGHEFTDANTMKRSDGGRRCRTCDNANNRVKYHRNKDAKGGGRLP